MKKQYIFLILIFIILYLLYLIVSYKYKEFIINNHLNDINKINISTKEKIKYQKEEIIRINTRAYKNKKLKEDQWYINIWEKVIVLVWPNKNTNNIENIKLNKDTTPKNNMSNIEKWKKFLFWEK